MSRTCTACSSPRRRAIDAAIVAGESIRNIAKRCGVSPAAIDRHKAHVAEKVRKAEVVQARTLLASIAEVRGRIAEVFAMLDAIPATELSQLASLESGYLDTKLRAIDRLAKVTELEFGTKSKVEHTAKLAAPASPTEELEQLEELAHDVAARRSELLSQVAQEAFAKRETRQ